MCLGKLVRLKNDHFKFGCVSDRTALNGVLEGVNEIGRVTGCLSIRLRVDGERGTVKAIDALCDTLVPDPDDYQGIIGETEEGEPVCDAPCFRI